MSAFEIITVIIALLVLIVFFAVLVLQELDDRHKTDKTQEEKMEAMFIKLFTDNASLNDDALNAYKDLIQASFNASQTQKQDKRRW